MNRCRRIRLFVLLAAVAVGSASRAPARDPADRILAVVDDDPILESEVEQVISFGLIQPQEGEDHHALQRRTLDFLIEERLRFHEVDRFGFAEVPVDVVEEQYRLLQERFGGEEEFAKVLERLGLNEQGAHQVLARQVMVWVYVEERLGARIFVGLDDIRTYYDEVLVPEVSESGKSIPSLEEVREPIRALLREQRMNDELERWTTDLVQQADIEDYFESNYRSLPPILDVRESVSD